MSTEDEIVSIALRVKPDQATLVPERRQELTTEGGLDVVKYKTRIKKVIDALTKKGILVSLFIDPVKGQIKASKDIGAPYIELHTGRYANAKSASEIAKELKRIEDTAYYAHAIGLGVNAGHGLNYDNVKDIAKIAVLEELNIGFSIVAESVFAGLGEAVRRMKELIR
jgi:pyridoxine 5-phosphate synthase